MLEFCEPKTLVSLFQDGNPKMWKVTMSFIKIWSLIKHITKTRKTQTLFECFFHKEKQEETSLHLVLISFSIKPFTDGALVGDRKWLESIHISDHIWLTNQNA